MHEQMFVGCVSTHIHHVPDTGNCLMWVPRRRQGGLFWIAQYPHWAATWGFQNPIAQLQSPPQTIFRSSYNLPGAQWHTVAENKGPRWEQNRVQEILGMVHDQSFLTRCQSVACPAACFFLTLYTYMWVRAYLVSACENQALRYFDSSSTKLVISTPPYTPSLSILHILF